MIENFYSALRRRTNFTQKACIPTLTPTPTHKSVTKCIPSCFLSIFGIHFFVRWILWQAWWLTCIWRCSEILEKGEKSKRRKGEWLKFFEQKKCKIDSVYKVFIVLKSEKHRENTIQKWKAKASETSETAIAKGTIIFQIRSSIWKLKG